MFYVKILYLQFNAFGPQKIVKPFLCNTRVFTCVKNVVKFNDAYISFSSSISIFSTLRHTTFMLCAGSRLQISSSAKTIKEHLGDVSPLLLFPLGTNGSRSTSGEKCKYEPSWLHHLCVSPQCRELVLIPILLTRKTQRWRAIALAGACREKRGPRARSQPGASINTSLSPGFSRLNYGGEYANCPAFNYVLHSHTMILVRPLLEHELPHGVIEGTV
jgi:hypothetical protein